MCFLFIIPRFYEQFNAFHKIFEEIALLFLVEKCSALGGVSHHCSHSIDIVRLKHGLQIVEFADKQKCCHCYQG